MDAAAYLETIKLRLASSPVVRSIVIVQERGLPDQGFFRARLTLKNDDFVEVTEYFVVFRRPGWRSGSVAGATAALCRAMALRSGPGARRAKATVPHGSFSQTHRIK